MADYKKVSIDITENGYIVTVQAPAKSKGKKFIFESCAKMKEWMKDNLAPTGEVDRFSKALDEKPKNDSINMVGYLNTTPISSMSYVVSSMPCVIGNNNSNV